MTPNKAERTYQQAIATFRSYRERARKIFDMLTPGTYYGRGAGEPVRQAAAALKEAVTREYKRPAAERSNSHVDQAFYDPCIRELFAAMQNLHLNTSPGPKWANALGDADITLSHWIGQLESTEKQEAADQES